HPRPISGAGGHCIPVAPWFLGAADRENAKLLSAARGVNDSKREAVLAKVLERAERLKHPTIAALGLAFKANIDDLRESPSKNIAVALTERLGEGSVLVVEPNIDALPHEFDGHDNVELTDLEDAVERADIVLLLVDHDPFRTLDREKLQEKVVIDAKGLWR